MRRREDTGSRTVADAEAFERYESRDDYERPDPADYMDDPGPDNRPEREGCDDPTCEDCNPPGCQRCGDYDTKPADLCDDQGVPTCGDCMAEKYEEEGPGYDGCGCGDFACPCGAPVRYGR